MGTTEESRIKDLDEEIEDIEKSFTCVWHHIDSARLAWANATPTVEAKLREKNGYGS